MRANLLRKLLAYLTLSLYLLCLLPTHTEAWGPEGHRIVARVAKGHLSNKARREIKKILRGTPLDSVATWADAIRPFRPETRQWHFVDIPKDKTNYDPARDCRPTRQGDCVIEAIEQFKVILADTSETPHNRAEALKFLVHFVGDLHQPLHCADDNDRGGNEVKVKFYGKASNLHKVWDSGIIKQTRLTETGYIRRLNAALSSQNITALQGGTVVDWALESHQAAVEYAYGKKPASNSLDSSYFRETRPIVDARLMKAGARLARVLNEALSH